MTESTVQTSPTQTGVPAQVYHVFIKATPEAIWEAITSPEWSERYFYGARISVTPDAYTSRGPDGADWGSSHVIEFDPPRRLVHGWRSLYHPDLAEEPESRVTWEITPGDDGVSLLTVTHDHLEGSSRTAESVAGTGWMRVLSGLKTLLETGAPLG
ncbi:ATPase [Intrasporangium oryzae NRRL B-24470]|uniref:ATPase n=1 Tax=Intrasporangium oryzae NRRL B-24470 TaxID=1386089 RepID=W9GC88_9MICO|nr:SRPBCC domain-containing protein [Intrasporangium oryzae]EWT01464.1 ATPase [Intrasporangium oryzae NRRL B-24470]